MHWGEAMDWQVAEWYIQGRTGWTLDYIRSLDIEDIINGLAYWRGVAKIEEIEQSNRATWSEGRARPKRPG